MSGQPSGQRSFARVPSTSVCLVRNLLENQRDLNSDSSGEEDFVPSKKDLESSEDEDDEEEVADLDSDEEVVLKRRRRASSCQTPRSKRRSQASRTPRRTPNKVTEPKFPQNDEGRTKMSCAELLFLSSRVHRCLERRGLPAFPAGPCQPDSHLTFWRRPEPGETHKPSRLIGSFTSVLGPCVSLNPDQ